MRVEPVSDARAGTNPHPLARLLTPRSVALIGASPKPDSVGRGMIQSIRGGGYAGEVHLVNPNYAEIDGSTCYPTLAALPAPVDLAVIGVANARIEAQLKDAIRHSAGAATIFGSCYLPDDFSPPLTERIAAMARDAGLPICGGNGMGFYNLDHGLRVCGFPPPDWIEAGPIALITHSGSVFSALCHNDRRLRYNLAVSAGQELATTAAEYLDFALEQDSTRVVGLFLEAVRRPAAFMAALARAADRDIPVIVLKVGRTAESAALAVSHSGAIAGDHAAFQAAMAKHDVIQVDTLDEFANALLFFSQPRRVASGSLASMHDSGGEREFLVDLAAARKVPFARIDAETTRKLAARLDYGLEPINPLDAWGTGHDYESIFADCMSALLEDPDVAVGALFVETRSGHYLSEGYARAMLKAASTTSKLVIIATNLAMTGADDLALHLTRAGVPVLNGADAALAVIRAAFDRRDRRAGPPMCPSPAPTGARGRWEPRLRSGAPLDEAESLALMTDYGVPVQPHRIVESAAAALAAARDLGFPVALKTAMPGILHKTDAGGVQLGLAEPAGLATAYEDMARRLGPRMLLMPIAPPGTELAFGAVSDAQFGPVVMAGAGGILIELLRDRQFALPPFDEAAARRLLDALALRPLLDGRRGRPPADVEALAAALARFSVLVADLGDLLKEIDVNPLLAGPAGCVALDALVIPKPPAA